MRDAEYRTQRARVKACIREWHPRLAEGTTVTHEWFASLSDMPKDMQDAQMFCRSKWQYGQATMGICCDGLADLDDDQVEEMLVHEYMHIRVAPMRAKHGMARETEEFVCTQLARAFIRTRDSERRRAK